MNPAPPPGPVSLGTSLASLGAESVSMMLLSPDLWERLQSSQGAALNLCNTKYLKHPQKHYKLVGMWTEPEILSEFAALA